jgi:hypothetical protein
MTVGVVAYSVTFIMNRLKFDWTGLHIIPNTKEGGFGIKSL